MHVEQVARRTGRWYSGLSDDLFQGREEARRVFGRRAERKGSGLTLFAYMWRRFGPPFTGCDDHKDLAGYLLTTTHKDVLLEVLPSASSMVHAFGYAARPVFRHQHDAPLMKWLRKHNRLFFQWWCEKTKCTARSFDGLTESQRAAFSEALYDIKMLEEAKPFLAKAGPRPPRRYMSEARKTVVEALRATMEDLKRPVYVRDVAIDPFGVYKGVACEVITVEHSSYAGYGMPKAALDRFINS